MIFFSHSLRLTNSDYHSLQYVYLHAYILAFSYTLLQISAYLFDKYNDVDYFWQFNAKEIF